MRYRPELKVVDCTIRDGGLTNDSHFDLETVRAVYQAACGAGVDYVELGYRNCKKQFSPEQYGKWRFCDESDLRAATDGIDPKSTKIAVMQDAHKANAADILPFEESVVDLIRVATYVKDIDKAVFLANSATGKGYDCTINIMAISHEGPPTLDMALQQIEEDTQVKAVYIVDSFGALYSAEVHFLVEKFQMYLKTKEVGFHGHNSLQLAFSNTIDAIVKGVNWVDGTFMGLGRGPGNCPLELLLGFVTNPRFEVLPALKVITEHIAPLREQIAWGYQIPYMLSGQFDKHPLQAMQWMAGPEKDDFVKFYQQLTYEG